MHILLRKHIAHDEMYEDQDPNDETLIRLIMVDSDDNVKQLAMVTSMTSPIDTMQ